MWEHIAAAIPLVLAWNSLLLMLIGVVVGIIMGALPGMTATMTVAILVSFTYGMPPLNGMMLLLGIYASALYAGSIPAILIRIPGTPSSAAAVLDGYPICQRGEAGRGIGISTFSSFFGGVFGTFIALFLASWIAKFAIGFGSSEYFALAFFGLTIIANISEGYVIKGLIAGFLGMLLSQIGIDPIQGSPRFTFQNVNLVSGIAFIPVMIGLFGLSEGLAIIEKIHARDRLKQALSNIVPSWSDIKRMMSTIPGATFIGAFVGAAPGTGGDIASFVSYNERRRWAKDKSAYGKGSIDGLTAAETAKNAATAGALVPTLALGIPGDSVTAIMIGALMVHGLRPGPLFFESNPTLAYGIYVGFIVVYVMILVLGLLGARMWARVISAPANYLWPVIFVLCVVGSFAMRSSLFDVWSMFGAGILGYFLRRGKYPLAPMVLGIILGPICETNLRRSLILSAGSLDFLYMRPITLALMVLSLVSIILPLIRNRQTPVTADGPE
jgi:putative tricarboxylic transport membrane protein